MPHHDLVVIGAGPGGYVAAIRAAQLGLNAACVDKNQLFGGTCLRVGCIPSKALLESSEQYEHARHSLSGHGIAVEGVSLDLDQMMLRKDRIVGALTKGIEGLLKKNKVKDYRGFARIDGPNRVVVDDGDSEQIIEAEHILIASGSVASSLPNIEIDGDRVVTSTEALSFPSVPEELVVIGAGYIGLEMGTVWRRLGSKVTVVEYLDRILPGMDSELAADAKKLFTKQGLDFQLGMKVTAAKVSDGRVTVEFENGEPLEADRALVAVGRRPFTEGLGLETVGVQPDDRGFLTVDENFRTSASNVYAIGDVIGGAMLAHKAEEEGIACVEAIAKGVGHVNYNAIPAVVYTDPEIATVGKTEDQLQEEGIDYTKGKFPFLANGRARALGYTDGYVKLLADRESDRILGVHILGTRAGDLIAECATAMEFGASAEDLARTCHAHPTLSEAVKESALAAGGRVIHI